MEWNGDRDYGMETGRGWNGDWEVMEWRLGGDGMETGRGWNGDWEGEPRMEC